MSESRRTARVGASIRSALAEILSGKLQDPSLEKAGLISVTGVNVSGDLGLARVYVVGTCQEPEAVESMLKGLSRAAPFLRSELASRLRLRKTPELRFFVDSSILQGRHIESILKELSDKEPADEKGRTKKDGRKRTDEPEP